MACPSSILSMQGGINRIGSAGGKDIKFDVYGNINADSATSTWASVHCLIGRIPCEEIILSRLDFAFDKQFPPELR